MANSKVFPALLVSSTIIQQQQAGMGGYSSFLTEHALLLLLLLPQAIVPLRAGHEHINGTLLPFVDLLRAIYIKICKLA